MSSAFAAFARAGARAARAQGRQFVRAASTAGAARAAAKGALLVGGGVVATTGTAACAWNFWGAKNADVDYAQVYKDIAAV